MPGTLPTARDLHVRTLFQGFAIAHGQDLAKDYVSDRAATVVGTDKQSNFYPVWSKADFFRDQMRLWADGDDSAEGGFRVDTTNKYDAKRYALKSLLTKFQRAQAKGELAAEDAKIRWLSMQAKIRRDKVLADTAFKTGVWTENTEQTGVTGSPSADEFQFFNEGGSDPFGVITGQMNVVQLSTGKLPNVALLNPKVNRIIKDHADIIDRTKHTGRDVPTEAILAGLFGLDEWIVGNAVENTAAEGVAVSMARIFEDSILLMHRTPAMSEVEPTALALFAFDEFDEITPESVAIESWFDEDKDGDWFRAKQFFDVKITSNDLGVFLKGAVA